MDRTEGLTAADVVNTWSQEELRRILSPVREERYAPTIAAAIVRRRQERPIETTLDLVDVIKSGMRRQSPEGETAPGQAEFSSHPHCRQRRAVLGRSDAPGRDPPAEPGGTAGCHHLPLVGDRIVKTGLAAFAKGCTCPPDFPVCVCGKTPDIKLLSRKPILPRAEEIAENPPRPQCQAEGGGEAQAPGWET